MQTTDPDTFIFPQPNWSLIEAVSLIYQVTVVQHGTIIGHTKVNMGTMANPLDSQIHTDAARLALNFFPTVTEPTGTVILSDSMFEIEVPITEDMLMCDNMRSMWKKWQAETAAN